MSIIYCSNCGSKHGAGSRFCSSCGNALSNFAAPKQRVQNPQVEIVDEETSFNRPNRLAYEIQKGGNTIFKGEDLFKSSPVNEQDRLNRPVGNVTKLTQEEYLSQSLKECAPRGMQDIDET